MVCKCEGIYIFYKLWIAARILNITKDEIKLLVRIACARWVISFTDASPWLNRKYISFVRKGLNLGKYGYSVNVSDAAGAARLWSDGQAVGRAL